MSKKKKVKKQEDFRPYCDHCGSEFDSFDELVISRSDAIGNIYYCPHCKEESIHEWLAIWFVYYIFYYSIDGFVLYNYYIFKWIEMEDSKLFTI